MKDDTHTVLINYLDTLEETPLWELWRTGEIDLDTYANVLIQLHSLHRALETALSESDPLGIFGPSLIQSDILLGDLYVVRQFAHRQPRVHPAVEAMATCSIPSWNENIPERIIGVYWFMESLRRRMLSLFGGTVTCLMTLPGNNRGLAYMRQPLSEYPTVWHRQQRRFEKRLDQSQYAHQGAVGIIHLGELLDHVFRSIVPDLYSTRG